MPHQLPPQPTNTRVVERPDHEGENSQISQAVSGQANSSHVATKAVPEKWHPAEEAQVGEGDARRLAT